jgi:hypothetical protein
MLKYLLKKLHNKGRNRMVIRGNLTIEKLYYIYDTINRIVENDFCYYSDEETEKLREDEKNIFLKKQ